MAWPRCVRPACVNGSGSPPATAQLRMNQVDADHAFRHRMLDLQARVHFEKVEARVVAFTFEQELAGAGIAIAHGLRGGDRRRAHPLANRRPRPGHGLSSTIF